MEHNNWIEVVREALRGVVPFLLGIFVSKNNAKENANDLVKKAKKATRADNADPKPK